LAIFEEQDIYGSTAERERVARIAFDILPFREERMSKL